MYLTNTRTEGASGAWNTGLDWLRRHAGDPQNLLVAVLDDDDEWTQNHLQECITAADTQGLDMVAAALVRISSHAPDRIQVPPSKLDPDLFLIGNPHIQGSNLFARLSALLEAGGFDESLASCTDRDLCIRLADLGWVRYAMLDGPTVRHHADATRPRLSSPTNDPKRRGLDRFWSKWHSRMSEAQRRASSDRARSYFGWTPPVVLEAPTLPVGPLVPLREPTGIEKVHADDLVLVVGVIADDEHADQFARLLEDLLELQSFDQVCCLDVVVLLNGATTGGVTRAVSTYRERGLTVFLATEEQQAADAASGRFGAGFSRPTGRAPIGPARTMLQAYVTRVSAHRTGAIAWILDDDSRLRNLTDHHEAPQFKSFLPSLGRMRALGVDVVLGSITGDPPIPPGSTVRTQLVDLYHNLTWLAGLDAAAPLPDRRAENRISRAAARDYYYDLSRRDTHHLEWPFWLTPCKPGEQVGGAFARMVESLPRILAGQGVFRPLLLDSPLDAIASMRPSVQRGTNTFVFDCAAFTDFPNLSPRFAGDVLRRSDMIWALLNRYAGGRRLVSATLPIRHDRSDEPPVGLDLGRLVGDIRGYALYSALEDVLVRRRERRLRDGIGAETPDDLTFNSGDLDLAVARFRKYLIERTAALLWSCWRIRGVCRALRDLAEGRTFKGAFFHRDLAWRDRLGALWAFLERTKDQFDIDRVEQVCSAVVDVPPKQVREFLCGLQSAVASHRQATTRFADDEWFKSERIASATSLARTTSSGVDLRLLGAGGEGVVFAASGEAIKVIDYSKRSTANGAWHGMHRLVAQSSEHGLVCRCVMQQAPGGRVVIRRPLEEGEPYRGGSTSDILVILKSLLRLGVVTTNFHPKELLSTSKGVRLIDYGADIQLQSEQGLRLMVQRAWLTLRFAERPDLSQLMRRALEIDSLPELEGWQSLLAAIDPPTKHEVVDEAILEVVRRLRPRRVLDFGCGHGRLAAALAVEGIDVVAFDPDSTVQDHWRRLSADGGDRVRWITGHAGDALAAYGGAFDVIVCSLVLCVIEDQAEYEAAIRAMSKSLAPGGRCVILVCNPDSTLAGDSTLQRRFVSADSAPERTFTWTKELPSGARRRDVHRPRHKILADLARNGLHASDATTTGGLSLVTLLPSRDHLLVTAEAASRHGGARHTRATSRLMQLRHPADVPVLCYHRVLPVDYSDAVCELQRQRGTVVELDVFRRHLDDLTNRFEPVSLAQYAAWLDGRTKLPDAACLVTFDDGYRDFLQYALPLLKAKQVPAILFPTMRSATRGGLLPVDSLYSALTRAQQEGRINTTELEAWTRGARKREYIRASADAQALLLQAAGLRPTDDIAENLYLSEDELIALPLDLVALGGHGVDHQLLDQRNLSLLRRELRRTRFWLDSLNHRRGGEPPVFAYPNGSQDDLTVAAMIEADFEAAFTIVPWQPGRWTHRWAIRRSCIPNRISAIRELAEGKEVQL